MVPTPYERLMARRAQAQAWQVVDVLLWIGTGGWLVFLMLFTVRGIALYVTFALLFHIIFG